MLLFFSQTLRDSLWKARDSVAESEKVCEEKLKATRNETEQRCKAIKAETLAKARDDQKDFLTQLFPTVKVDTEDFSSWLDEFEIEVEALVEDYKGQVCKDISCCKWK